MQVLAHRQPAGAECVHPAAQVGGHGAPGRRVGPQERVGRIDGVHEPRALGIDDHVPGAAVGDLEADARPAGRDVEDVGVIALDERAQGTGRCSGHCRPQTMSKSSSRGSERRPLASITTIAAW